jgi:sigma-B regulation protein RsbU (phosphoserine phosphatase)
MSVAGAHRVLVVDDDPGLRYTLERILSPLYQVDVVGGAVAARERLARHSYDLALVDVRLGDGDGYSVCRELRQLRPQTDVILITGSLSEPDEKLYRALEEGAFYFLFKPFDRRVLQALVERCLRLQRERTAKEAHARTLAADLDKARRFQRSLLPPAPVAAAGWLVEGRLRSCDELGGDLFHAQPWDGAGVVFSLSDVVGHGVGAAMVAGMLRSTLVAARRRNPEPAQVASELLAGIDFFEGALCATLIYGLLAADGRLRYANAGHPPLLWHGSDGVRRLGATGTLLHHALRDRPLPAAEVQLAPGDRLLVCSDGAFEARNPADQELGLEALEEAFVASRPLPAAAALDTLLATVRRHCAGRPLQDDLTLVLIERVASGA